MFENLIESFEIAQEKIDRFLTQNKMKTGTKKQDDLPLSDYFKSESPKFMTEKEVEQKKNLLQMKKKKTFKSSKDFLDDLYKTISEGIR